MIKEHQEGVSGSLLGQCGLTRKLLLVRTHVRVQWSLELLMGSINQPERESQSPGSSFCPSSHLLRPWAFGCLTGVRLMISGIPSSCSTPHTGDEVKLHYLQLAPEFF